MITVILLGSIALLWVVVHLIWRARRIKQNAYDRFLHDQTLDTMRVDDLRFMKLRIAALKAREQEGNSAAACEVEPPSHE